MDEISSYAHSSPSSSSAPLNATTASDTASVKDVDQAGATQVQSDADGRIKKKKSRSASHSEEDNEQSPAPPATKRSRSQLSPPPKEDVTVHQSPHSTDDPVLKKLRRTMNGYINKLTDEKKSSILQSIQQLFAVNSSALLSEVLLDCLLPHLTVSAQKISIPSVQLYCSLICALHRCNGSSVGHYAVDKLFHAFLACLDLRRSDLDWSKAPHSLLLVLVYFYNMNILSYTVLYEFLECFLTHSDAGQGIYPPPLVVIPDSLKVEFVECILSHSGDKLKKEDIHRFLDILQKVKDRYKDVSEAYQRSVAKSAVEGQGYSRMHFLLEVMQDFESNRMHKMREKHVISVKEMKKWLSSVSPGGAERVAQIECTLIELMEHKLVMSSDQEEIDKIQRESIVIPKKSTRIDEELEELVTKNAKRLRLNTPIKRAVFAAIARCRDVIDAHEKIMRLHLGANMDRDLVRVLMECCAAEPNYNPFYVELGKLFCETNPKCKLSFEYAFWDEMKAFQEVHSSDNDQEHLEQRVVNIASMLADLILAFKLSLSALRNIDVMSINEHMILFLSTFFVTLFTRCLQSSEKSAEKGLDVLEKISDRVARSKHFESTRQVILYFLKNYLSKFPPGLDPRLLENCKLARKVMMKSMKVMAILNFDNK